jgi:transmembrane protein, putative
MSNVVNSTLVNNPHLSSHFPVDFFGPQMFDDMINNTYVHGREWLQNFIKNSLNTRQEVNYNVSRAVENQMLEVWDRVYHQWLIRSTNSTYHIQSFEAYQWDRLVAAFKALNFTLCFNLIKENLDTFLSVCLLD